MSKPSNDKKIKAGDLVMVVKPRPCCKESSMMGYAFTVLTIKAFPTKHRQAICRDCRRTVSGVFVASKELTSDGKHHAFFIEQLIKIDPDGVNDSIDVTINKPIKETA